ncbi:hypothetical protein [Nitriliruptor alkaliphilus]|uniref:hypothetical protein n=1 Tax=Nitriliruptor alkaliphilus TaxID=427918 RepID=UPI000696A01E|nr:hypothetical protein [Nitriliruptor alkaliphilus]
MSGRLSVLTVAGARSAWSGAVARWAASAVLPVEVVRCVSIGEVRARLATGRPWSALLADAALSGVDRDLVAAADVAGCPTILVDEDGGRDLQPLGAAAVLGAPFSRDELLGVLALHGRQLAPGRVAVVPDGPAPPAVPGTLLAVTGTGGSGTSTVAAALAQGLGNPRPGRRYAPVMPRRDVVLADLCRRADQAVLHDARVLVPGLREVVDAHRTSTPSAADLRAQTFALGDRGYHLLLGLRRPAHWATLPPRAVDALLDGLRTAFEVTVADVDPDLEGEAVSGSFDVEERHHLTRAALARADVTLVTGEPTTLGCAKLVRLVADVLAHEVEPHRLLLVLPRSPRSPRARAELVTALADLLRGAVGPAAERIASPLGLPERPVDEAVRDGAPLPASLPDKLATAVAALLGRVGTRASAVEAAPTPIRPGELGLATEDRPLPGPPADGWPA